MKFAAAKHLHRAKKSKTLQELLPIYLVNPAARNSKSIAKYTRRSIY
jgi:hypothetical protein